MSETIRTISRALATSIVNHEINSAWEIVPTVYLIAKPLELNYEIISKPHMNTLLEEAYNYNISLSIHLRSMNTTIVYVHYEKNILYIMSHPATRQRWRVT